MPADADTRGGAQPGTSAGSAPDAPDAPLSLLDYERLAAERLPRMTFDYYAGGSDDEHALRENRAAFERIRLLPRVLVDVSRRDPSTVVLGRRHPSPLLIAPMAFARMAHPDGEAGVARGAGAAGVTMAVSTLATTTLEDVAAAASAPLWFQIYVFRDRDLTRAMVQRVEQAGYEALVLTVDAPLLGRRERDARNRFVLPEGMHAENLRTPEQRRLPRGADSGLALYAASQFDQSLTWPDLEWLQSITRLPVLVKGVLHPADARLAVEHGAAGVIVSNHGGRQLDAVPAAIDALPAVVAAVAGRADVLMDGGVRRGTDVVKALALGAAAVLIGRPVLWALAIGGEAGVRDALALLQREFDLALALVGCPSATALDADLIAPR